jgi:hypothetical protein
MIISNESRVAKSRLVTSYSRPRQYFLILPLRSAPLSGQAHPLSAGSPGIAGQFQVEIGCNTSTSKHICYTDGLDEVKQSHGRLLAW